MNVIDIQLSKKYTKDTASEFGAVKGAPCTVGGYSFDADGNTIVTLKWTNSSGTSKTTDITIKKGEKGEQGIQGVKGDNGQKGENGNDGISITSVEINSNNHLIVHFSNGTSSDVGELPTSDVAISQESGNAIVEKADGLYVATTGVEISQETNNAIENKTDGLYVQSVDISNKVDKVNGKGLSTVDFTDTNYVHTDNNFTNDYKQQVTDNELAIGDTSKIVVSSITDLVTYCNGLYMSFMSSITYADKKLTITYRNGATQDIDMSPIITDTNIDELKNILVTNVTDGQHLIYNGATQKWENKDFKLSDAVDEAKSYTDEKIGAIDHAQQIACDEKPTYDATTKTVTYKINGETKTTTNPNTWFFYKVGENTVQTIWIDDVEFTLNVGQVDLSTCVKVADVVDTCGTDTTKIPNVSAIDKVKAYLVEEIGKKVNTLDIVDGLTSESTNVPLSANQGRVLKGQVDEKVAIVEVTKAQYEAGKATYDAMNAIIKITDESSSKGDAGQIKYGDSNVKSALDGLKVDVTKVDTVNLFKAQSFSETTQNGITCTSLGDGTFKLNGTATANAWIAIGSIYIPQIDCYILGSNNDNVGIYINGQTSTAYNNIRIVVDADKGSTKTMGIAVKTGAVLSDVIAKPMLTNNINATYNTFVAYTGDTGHLNSDVAEIKSELDDNPFLLNTKEYIISNGKSCVPLNYRDFTFSSYNRSTNARKIPNGVFFPTRTQTGSYFSVGVDVWYDLSKYSKLGYDITIGDTRYTEEIDIADKNTRYIVLFDFLPATGTHAFRIHTSSSTSYADAVALKEFTNISNKSVLVHSLYLVI